MSDYIHKPCREIEARHEATIKELREALEATMSTCEDWDAYKQAEAALKRAEEGK